MDPGQGPAVLLLLAVPFRLGLLFLAFWRRAVPFFVGEGHDDSPQAHSKECAQRSVSSGREIARAGVREPTRNAGSRLGPQLVELGRGRPELRSIASDEVPTVPEPEGAPREALEPAQPVVVPPLATRAVNVGVKRIVGPVQQA